MENQVLPHLIVETSKSPTASVIWLHGLGADGHDFAPIVHEMNLSSCPGIRFVFPHAPTMPVTINNGYPMPAWYDITGATFQDRQDESGIERTRLQIEALIAQENEKGIDSSNIVLAGFSQGCAIALYTGLLFSNKLAGIVALSGYLPLLSSIEKNRNPANFKTPIFMAHGSQDNIVPLEWGNDSCQTLEKWGYDVTWKSYSMLHSVHPQEIADIADFLHQTLSE